MNSFIPLWVLFALHSSHSAEINHNNDNQRITYAKIKEPLVGDESSPLHSIENPQLHAASVSKESTEIRLPRSLDDYDTDESEADGDGRPRPLGFGYVKSKSFLTKKYYSLGDINPSYRKYLESRGYQSRCRCERISNCPKLQVSVPRCPEEYFMCCF